MGRESYQSHTKGFLEIREFFFESRSTAMLEASEASIIVPDSQFHLKSNSQNKGKAFEQPKPIKKKLIRQKISSSVLC